jgi:hypothetical protein
VEDKSFPGYVTEITALCEEDVGVELGAPIEESRNRFQALLSRCGVVVQVRDEFRPEASGEAGLDALLEEFNASPLGDQSFAVYTHYVVG